MSGVPNMLAATSGRCAVCRNRTEASWQDDEANLPVGCSCVQLFCTTMFPQNDAGRRLVVTLRVLRSQPDRYDYDAQGSVRWELANDPSHNDKFYSYFSHHYPHAPIAADSQVSPPPSVGDGPPDGLECTHLDWTVVESSKPDLLAGMSAEERQELPDALTPDAPRSRDDASSDVIMTGTDESP